MSDNPEKAAIPGNNDSEDTTENANFETRINKVVENLTRDEKGKYIVPEDLSEAERFAVLAEKRRRDTQAEYTKTSQKVKMLEAEKTTLLKKVTEEIPLKLTTEQAEELEDLKFSDPEAYRKKMNTYERDHLAERTRTIDEELKQVSTSSLVQEELERRKEILADFTQARPDFVINDDVISNDIPPRIRKRMETGEVSFEDFLNECYNYLKTGKVVRQEELPGKQPNLSKVGGGSQPDDNAVKEDIHIKYKKTIF